MKEKNLLFFVHYVVILDEPSLGLDIEANHELQSILYTVAKESKQTFIISSHDIELLSSITNEYVFIFSGKCVEVSGKELSGNELINKYFEVKERFNAK